MKHRYYTIALAAMTTALSAQTNPGTTGSENEEEVYVLPPVYVTGELWDSQLEQTTASVSVFDESSLDLKASQHFDDLIQSVPNLTWTGGTSRPRYFQVRGIGENSQFEGETPDSSVRFLIDDIDLTGLGTVANLFDTRQVEVLRGPQAGAFGANAAGGMIKIVSTDPTPYWTGQTELSLGTDALRAGGLAVGGPILENDPEQLTFRFSLYQHYQDGFRENDFLNRDDTNERDELSSRLKLRWIANPDLQIDASVLYADTDNGYDEFSLDNTGFTTFSDEPGRDEQETLGISAKALWDGSDEFNLTAITSYTQTDSLYSYDADWADPTDPRSYNGFLSTIRDRETASQELRLDSKTESDALGWMDRWTIGTYWSQIEERSDVDYADDFGVAAVDSNYEADNWALFAQGAHDFTERTRLSLGLRLEHTSVKFGSTTTTNYFGLILPGTTISEQDGWLYGGKLSLEHDLNYEHMVFGSITRGYKAGGANGGFRTAGNPATYEDETLWNYELGLRSNWFDNTITTSLTAFYLDRSNAQLRDSAGSGGFFNYFTSNQGDAAHYGLEGEFTYHFAKDWSLSGGLGLLETERDSTDRDLANAPQYNYNARLSYSPEAGLFGNIELTGQDDRYESNSHNQQRTAFNVVNATIGYRIDNWTFTLWAKNLFDEDYEKRVFYFDNGGGTQRFESPADPRQFGITANYSF